MTRVLVTSAAHPTGRNAVRALVQYENIKVFATDSREQALARLPFDVPKVKLPLPEDVTFVETIKQYCVQNDIEVIIPGGDAMALGLSRNKAFFAASGISIPVPDYEVLIRGVDKSKLVESANAAGLPCAKSICIRSESDIEKIESLAYPVIAKTKIGFGARGVQIYERPPSDWSKLKKALTKGDMLVQEYIPGGAGSIHACNLLFDQKHELKFVFQQKSTKTEFEFGGAGLAGVSVRDPTLLSYGERFIRELGPWVGMVSIEFKRHLTNGELYIMDCNARVWGLCSMAQDSGLAFPFAAVLVAKNENFRTHKDYLTNVRTERQGLSDDSIYSFCHGKQLNIPLRRANERRTVALITNEHDKTRISSALENAEFHAVVVLKTSELEISSDDKEQEKLYFWLAPVYLRKEELPYWVAHLFKATEVQVMNGGSCESRPWRELQQAWWFGAN